MPHIHVNDIDLYYEWQGDEAKDLLILNNGIFMSSGSWVFQTPRLARHFRRGEQHHHRLPGPAEPVAANPFNQLETLYDYLTPTRG